MTEISLRDFFAAAALIGELSAQTEEGYGIWDRDIELAKLCYQRADAMLEVREKAAMVPPKEIS